MQIKSMKAVLLSFFISPNLLAGTQDRVDYKLTRMMQEVQSINAAVGAFSDNVACQPITQALMDQNDGVFTIGGPGLWCLTENVFGTIVVGANSVSLDLGGYVLDAEDAPQAISSTQTVGLKIFNGYVQSTSDAGILVTGSTSVEIFDLGMQQHANDSIRVIAAGVVYVHNVDFFSGVGSRAIGFESAAMFRIENCSMGGYQGCSPAVLELDSCTDGVVRGIDVTTNCADGIITVNNSDSIDVVDCRIFNNSTTLGGIVFNSATNSSISGCKLGDNSASSITLMGENFAIDIADCICNNSSIGVNFLGANTDVAVINVRTNNNSVGFNFDSGADLTCCIIKNCIANNTLTGFNYQPASLASAFVGNLAQCYDTAPYTFASGVINVQNLSWSTGTFTVVSGNADPGAYFANIAMVV